MSFKLYVVGEETSDPENWSVWSEYALVIATDEADARRLAGQGDAICVTEILMDRSIHLVSMHEPNHGNDI